MVIEKPGTGSPETGSQGSAAPSIGLLAGGYLLLVGGLLGISVIVAKLAITQGAEPLSFLVCAMFGAGIVLLGIAYLQGQRPVLNYRTLEYGVAAGLLFALPNALGFLAVRHVGAGFLSLTFAFPIIFTYIMALLLGMERFRKNRALGVVCGLAGGIVLTLSKVSLGDADPIWIALAMTSPLFLAAGNIYRTLRWPPGVSALFLAAMMLVGGSLCLLPVVLLFGQAGFVQLASVGPQLYLLVGQIAIYSIVYV
ncbi:MAG: DMT family transporter, partial [Fimbriimonadaceae bacterium]|nr:DMT family transporter [Alphaproteobacteria bacterium]